MQHFTSLWELLVLNIYPGVQSWKHEDVEDPLGSAAVQGAGTPVPDGARGAQRELAGNQGRAGLQVRLEHSELKRPRPSFFPLLLSSPSQSALLSPMASSLKRPTLSFFPTSHFVPLPIRASIPTVLSAPLPYGFVFKAAYPVFFPHFSFRPPPNPRFNPNRPHRFSPLWLRL